MGRGQYQGQQAKTSEQRRAEAHTLTGSDEAAGTRKKKEVTGTGDGAGEEEGPFLTRAASGRDDQDVVKAGDGGHESIELGPGFG